MEERKETNKKCKTCKYRGKADQFIGCEFILHFGRSRGCSVEECDKYEKGPRQRLPEHYRDYAHIGYVRERSYKNKSGGQKVC